MTDSIFENNFSKLKVFNPSLASEIEKLAELSSFDITIDEGKEVTLCVNGRQLTSHHDRIGYSKKAVSRLNLNKTVCIYGFGLGDEIREILKKNSNASIIVYLLNPSLFYQLLSLDDEIDFFFKNNIKFEIADNDVGYYQNSIIISPELYLAPEFCNSLKLKLLNVLDNEYAIKLHDNLKTLKEQNLKNNYEILKNSVPLSRDDLKNLSDEIIVTAAGPSLEDNIEKIKALHHQGLTLISVDSSLACLEKHNVIPDIIVSCDIRAYHSLKNHIFKNIELYKNTVLVHSANSEQSLISAYPYKKRMVYKKEDLSILNYLPQSQADFITFYGSVLNEAVEIAIKSSPKTIKLFGADFAFKGTQSHSGIATGAVIMIGEVKLTVLCNDGQLQNTQRNFSLYREELEKSIKRNPHIRFENYSKTGAVVHGAVFVDH